MSTVRINTNKLFSILTLITLLATAGWLFHNWETDDLTFVTWYISLVYWTGMTVLGLLYYQLFDNIEQAKFLHTKAPIRWYLAAVSVGPFLLLVALTWELAKDWTNTFSDATLALSILTLSGALVLGKVVFYLLYPPKHLGDDKLPGIEDLD